MAQGRRTAGLNVGQRSAPSLGGDDPRNRRPDTTASQTELVLAPPLYRDNRGRIAIRFDADAFEVDASGTLRLKT
jgi:hypothetical protein